MAHELKVPNLPDVYEMPVSIKHYVFSQKSQHKSFYHIIIIIISMSDGTMNLGSKIIVQVSDLSHWGQRLPDWKQLQGRY